MLVYPVRIEAPSEAVRSEVLGWLEDDHAGDVVRAGALGAEITLLDDGVIECRFRFASREAFEAYEAGPAVALREDGRARFGPERGVRMSRTFGELRVHRGRG
jgi:hypothetical protein